MSLFELLFKFDRVLVRLALLILVVLLAALLPRLQELTDFIFISLCQRFGQRFKLAEFRQRIVFLLDLAKKFAIFLFQSSGLDLSVFVEIDIELAVGLDVSPANALFDLV